MRTENDLIRNKKKTKKNKKKEKWEKQAKSGEGQTIYPVIKFYGRLN